MLPPPVKKAPAQRVAAAGPIDPSKAEISTAAAKRIIKIFKEEAKIPLLLVHTAVNRCFDPISRTSLTTRGAWAFAPIS